MIVLSKEQVISLHSQLIEETGGVGGLRDEGLLDSALNAPFQSFGNVEPFPSIQQKAARLGYGLIMNHPFVDGNKRIGAHVMLVFLALNGIELDYTQDELADVILGVASGETGFDELLKWIIERQL
ncbi:MAG: type II toxin-antitoxin system death-on-curing family toxin [Clostridiales bacterium]|nr:type II toxin-antitoxin system death-on-curing family toxin [Clostridiales bacterium]